MPPVGLARKGLMQINIDTTFDLLKIRHLNAGIAQLVEHDLAKVGVASSSLVSRSKFKKSGVESIHGRFFYVPRKSGYNIHC